MVQLKEIRTVIENGGSDDIHEVRRLALRATSRIADPALAAELQDRLLAAMAGIHVAPAMGPEADRQARQLALDVLGEIEKSSR